MTRVAIVETWRRCTLHKTRRLEKSSNGRQGDEEMTWEEKHWCMHNVELTDSEEDRPTYFSKRPVSPFRLSELPPVLVSVSWDLSTCSSKNFLN